MSTSQNEENDTFKILVATDIHLGFKHLDPHRGRDSIHTFREILQLARQNEVDFVLLGGDLFHENKPPRAAMHSCLQLLREYCVGDKPQSFQLVDVGTLGAVLSTNIDNPNLNISMPVFSIHGNHDEPTGPQLLSALDVIESAGLIHYFGKTSSIEELRVAPLLLQKGRTKLALYGVGYIRSNKLHQMYLNKAVTMTRPEQDTDGWFNVFVLHQNRVKRPDKTHIEESFIDDFIDLVIWGHEHESKIKPERSREGKFWVTQPGSTIATEFKRSEMVQKHVGLLTIHGREFELTPIPLLTVRQLFIEDYTPSGQIVGSVEDHAAVKRLNRYCKDRVEDLLSKAESSRTRERQPKKPLIRIRIQLEQCHFNAFSTSRFGSPFWDRVANPDSIVTFGRKTSDSEDDSSGLRHPHNPHFSTFTLEELLQTELEKEPEPLYIIQTTDVIKAIGSFVDLGEKSAIDDAFKKHLHTVQSQLKKKNLHTLDTPSEGSSLTDDNIENVQRDQIDKEIRKLHEEMQATSTGSPGSDTLVSPDQTRLSGGGTDQTRPSTSQHEDCSMPAYMDLEILDDPFTTPPRSSNTVLKHRKRAKEQVRADSHDPPSTSGLARSPNHGKSTTSRLVTSIPDHTKSTSSQVTSSPDHTESTSSGPVMSSPSHSKRRKRADYFADLWAETGQVKGTVTTTPSSSLEVLDELSTPVHHAHSPALRHQKPRPADNQVVDDGHYASASRPSIPSNFGTTAEGSSTRETLSACNNSPVHQSGGSGQNAETPTHILDDSDDDDVLILTTSDLGRKVWSPADKKGSRL